MSEHVPGVPNGDNITIDELLKMRSGLYNYTTLPSSRPPWTMTRPRSLATQELLALAFVHPPNFPPGQTLAGSRSTVAASSGASV